MSRNTVIVVLMVAAAMIGSCRCSNDDAAEQNAGESSSSSEVHESVTAGGERVVRGDPEPTPSPPPALPGERRRPRGAGEHPEPTEDDPENGEFTLEEATEGLEGSGPLVAEIVANLGNITCTLYPEKAPNAVANFVGLARGKRPWWDTHTGAWVRRPYYNGSNFHKVIPGVMIQGGSATSDGVGGPGYTLEDEFVDELTHNEAGVLSIVGSGDEGASGQFIILDGAAPHFNGRHVVIGRCEPTDAIFRIARVPQGGGNRPLTDVMIRSVTIRRGE